MIKKLLVIMLAAGVSYAVNPEINKSSFTATNDTLQQLNSATPTSTFFVGVVVSSPSAGGLLSVYDSQGAASQKITDVSLGTIQRPEYNVRVSSGLTYSITNNAAGVTILWR